jgi:hypothetical protein
MSLDATFLAAATRDHHLPVLQNNVFDKTRLLAVLKKKGRVFQEWAGDNIQWGVGAKKNPTITRFRGSSPLPSQQVNPVAIPTLPSGNYAVTIGITKEERLKNKGKKEVLIKMLETQMKAAEETLREEIGTDFYSDGSTVAGFNGIVGLRAIVDSDNTYAGIDRTGTGNSYWQANIDTTTYSDANLEDQTHAGYFPGLLYDAYTDATHDDAPDIVVTTKHLFNVYQLIAQAMNLRFDNAEANLGFAAVKFGPDVPVIFDDFCTTKHLFMFNTGDLGLYVVPGANFEYDTNEENGSIWLQPTDELSLVAHILFMGQLVCEKPRQTSCYTTLGT